MRTRSGEDGDNGSLLERLEQLHHEVDTQTARLAVRHAGRLQCGRGCASCCVDDITVFEIEAERIRRRHAELLRNEEPHPDGACAFLEAAGACRIYDERPYVCRTQGLPLRWEERRENGTYVEYRDICPLNDLPGQPLEELSQDDCWVLGPIEGRLAALRAAFAGTERPRVPLRGMFGETIR